MLSIVLLAAFGFASGAQGATSPGVAVGVSDQFSVSGVRVDATAPSPAAARDLAMKQGRSAAWRKLFQRVAGQSAEPQLAERELLALVLRSEARNERRNTTRYVADVTFHFNPAAVRHQLRRSNIAFTDVDEWGQFLDGPLPAPKGASMYLAINVRLDSNEDWASVQARLSAARGVAGVDMVGRTLHDAQIYLNYSGDVAQLQAALAEQALELTSGEGEYTLELGATSQTTTASLQ